MKKQLLSLLFMTVFGVFSVAQTVYADFESMGIEPFGAFGGAAYEAAANPDNTGINTSDNCGMATTGNETWSGMGGDNLGGVIDLTTNGGVFTMKVLSENVGAVMLKLELQADYENHNIEVSADYTTPNVWTELTFDVSAGEDQVYDHIVVFFDMNVGDADEIWYFDDIVGCDMIPGDPVDVTFQVTDLDNAATSIEIEVASDAGNKLALTNDGSGVWTANKTVPGNTFKTVDTYTIFIDGSALEDATDIELGVAAGAGTATVAYTFGGGLTDEAHAAYMGYDFPIIDGVADDDAWDDAIEYPITLPFGSESFVDGADLNGYFKAGWDESGIYVLVYREDDHFIGVLGDYGNPWERDKNEVYFDMNVDNIKDGKGADNGPANGHYQIALDFIENPGFSDWQTNGGLEAVWIASDTTYGNSYTSVSEYYMPFDGLIDSEGTTYTPDNDLIIGFDVTLIDNDGADETAGGVRNRLVWSNASDPESWTNMDGCGTLTFDGGVAVQGFENSAFKVYPNPVRDRLYISNASSIESVRIHNILGAEVTNVISNGNEISIPTGDLAKGIYMISIKEYTGAISTSKVIVE